MSEPCRQEANIAVIEQRLLSGDSKLDELSADMKDVHKKITEVGTKITTVLMHIEGEDGILAKQRIHGEVIGKIKNLEVIEKVNRHDKWYIVGAFLIGFLGLTSVSSIIALLFIIVRLYNTLHP